MKAIEFDVWLTQDEKLIVIHGGNNGEMPKPIKVKSDETQYIFQKTLSELQQNHIQTKYFSEVPEGEEQKCMVPEVREVFELVHCLHSLSGGTLMNIELKCPYDS